MYHGILQDVDTQNQVCNFLSHCFMEKNYEEALEVVRKIEDTDFDLTQLGDKCCGYYTLAAEAWLMAGHEERALNILRIGFEAGADVLVYNFGKKNDDKTSEYYERDLRLFLKLEKHPHLSDELAKMQKPFCPPLTPTSPFCYVEPTTLGGKFARDFLTDEKILKGEQVYSFLFFHPLSEGYKMFCKKDNFERDEKILHNYRCFKNNGYELSQYRHLRFSEPFVNRETFYFDAPCPEKLIELVAFPRTNSYDCNFSYCGVYGDRSLYNDGGVANIDNKNRDTVIAAVEKVNSTFSSDYLNLLYILYQCGYGKQMLSMLHKMSEDFPLSLMLLYDAEISAAAADYLGIPELPTIYDLIVQRVKTKNDRLKLIEFGVSHPHFQDLLAASLRKFPYHAWDCLAFGVPKWYNFVGISKKTVAFQDITLLLANRPELLFMTDKLCNEHLVIQYGRSNPSWAYRIKDIAMRDTLIYAALFQPSTADYWKKTYAYIYPEKNYITEQARAIWDK